MKKVVIGGLALFVVAGALIGFNRMCSMTRMGVDHVQNQIDEAIPVDVQLRELEMLLEEDLDPEIKKSQLAVVRQKGDITETEGDITQLMARVDQQWTEIEEMQAAIPADSKTEFVSINGKQYTRSKVTSDLGNKLTRYKSMDSSLNAKQELLSKQEETLAAKEQHLEKLMEAKVNVIAEIEDLKARLTLLKAKRIEVSDEVDNATIDRINELTRSIKRRVSEDEKMLEYETSAYGEIQMTPEADEEDVLKEIDEIRADKAVRGENGELINIR